MSARLGDRMCNFQGMLDATFSLSLLLKGAMSAASQRAIVKS